MKLRLTGRKGRKTKSPMVKALAKECGVAEASMEMWVASELFLDANKRAFFRAMQTVEARLAWIQMHCQ